MSVPASGAAGSRIAASGVRREASKLTRSLVDIPRTVGGSGCVSEREEAITDVSRTPKRIGLWLSWVRDLGISPMRPLSMQQVGVAPLGLRASRRNRAPVNYGQGSPCAGLSTTY